MSLRGQRDSPGSQQGGGPGVLAKWAKLLDAMKADGTYAKLTAGF
jgi:hypothetical protein